MPEVFSLTYYTNHMASNTESRHVRSDNGAGTTATIVCGWFAKLSVNTLEIAS